MGSSLKLDFSWRKHAVRSLCVFCMALVAWGGWLVRVRALLLGMTDKRLRRFLHCVRSVGAFLVG